MSPVERRPSRWPSRWRSASPWVLAGVLAVAGTAHFTATRSYERIIPPVLPYPRALVYVSGLAELACAAGLGYRRTRRLAGWATAALFVAVFPANVQMALAASGGSTGHRLISWGRLPLQIPLVWWAAQVARRSTGRRSSGRRAG